MCNKAVHFPSSLPDKLLIHQTNNDWYGRSLEQKPGIDEDSKQLIERVWEAVLDEQIDQWAAGESDPERMATVYRQHTASSQVKAIVHGLKVQQEAAHLCTSE
mmetsp:Transcript_39077/g.94493  ORF Transcript_39077/g.94493 Transcript_39077/m.94493 type:complete len:103 (-) Transcript_39077:317-625(-)|eukprot:CAMPEP_0113631470 /NCGR_PEP_ID=MMETSP0017_2-20120614/16354_1 /TAXON_ID=2856 /ORGANISM="Cylindrotheca closterium" /LENGTH=102 /DNA_ID=CAMNT_0000541981 /DNA_START=30 /DNA_END=338 /DNA_ORIENTATION=+ /assembly_acc=CAM_ASM_000147